MITRSQVGTFKPNPRFHGHTSHISPLPKSPSVALSDPHWRDVMYKARLVANGRNQQYGVNCSDTFSLVVKPATIRTVLSLALARNWPVHQIDVKKSFVLVIFRAVFIWIETDTLCLVSTLCGLCSSCGIYFEKIRWTRFFISQHGTMVAIFIDWTLFNGFIYSLCEFIPPFNRKEFDMTDLGLLIISWDFRYTRCRGVFFSKEICMELLERAHMSNCNSTRTPVDTESKLGSDGDPVSDSTLYHSLAGGLQYLTFTRPDISYTMQQICLHMHDPQEPHLAALKQVLRYVRGTLDYGLQLHVSSTSQLNAYTDADWAGCPVTRHAEAEYRGVANMVAETAWICNLLRELYNPLFTSTLVYCDNVSAVYMSTNPVQHQRTKHIEIDIHFVRDMVARGQVRVLHMPSRYQYADIFTKGLPSALFEEFHTSLSVRSSPAQTAEGC
ncbi:ribonuclease H-like domain-containing protein [Tanacetum coccineum]